MRFLQPDHNSQLQQRHLRQQQDQEQLAEPLQPAVAGNVAKAADDDAGTIFLGREMRCSRSNNVRADIISTARR